MTGLDRIARLERRSEQLERELAALTGGVTRMAGVLGLINTLFGSHFGKPRRELAKVPRERKQRKVS